MSSFRCRFKLIYRFYLKFIGGCLVFFRFFWVLHIMPKCDWRWYVSHIATQHTHKPTLYLSLAWNRPILVNLDRKKYQMIKSFWFALVRFQFDRYKIMLEFPPFVRERERESSSNLAVWWSFLYFNSHLRPFVFRFAYYFDIMAYYSGCLATGFDWFTYLRHSTFHRFIEFSGYISPKVWFHSTIMLSPKCRISYVFTAFLKYEEFIKFYDLD